MPKKELVRRIDLRPGSTGSYAAGGGRGGDFDDTGYVKRDGTRSMYSYAVWLWEMGCEVTGVLRSWGSGALEVFGKLYAGRDEGPHVKLEEIQREDGTLVSVLQTAPIENDPFFSTGVTEGIDETYDYLAYYGNPRFVWFNAGFEGGPQIHSDYKPGHDRLLPLVDPELLSRYLTANEIDVNNLLAQGCLRGDTLPDAFDYQPGTLFFLESPGDPNIGVLYVRDYLDNWEMLIGAGYAHIHSHTSDETGGYLTGAAIAYGGFDDPTWVQDETTNQAVIDEISGEPVSTGELEADEIPITDAGGYFGSYDTVEEALEYLASGITPSDASIVTYTPAVLTDWDSDADPGNVDGALDQLAERVDDLEGTPPGTPDAADVTYAPAVLTDWDSDADPGNVDGALDQLAERVDDLESSGGHAAVTLSVAADVLLSLSTQEIGLDTQAANTVVAGPTSGAAAAPTARALVAADMPSIGARVYHNANQTTTSGNQLLLAFNSERFDTNAIHDTVTNNSRLTCKTAGIYVICGSVYWDANSGGNHQLAIVLNVAGTPIASTQVNDAAGYLEQSISTIYQLAVNDYVQLAVTQYSGGNRTITVSGNKSPEFSMVRIG